MTSKRQYDEAYVWVWLPGTNRPVVAARLARQDANLIFNYGRSYLERAAAVPLYLPELPLKTGAIPPGPGLDMAGCLRDAAPDAWGRQVILNGVFGRKGKEVDTNVVDELTYLLASGSDRIGALDFQLSPIDYVPRTTSTVSLEELQSSSEKVEKGIPLSSALDQALIHGSSLGGARPKALIDDGERKMIAKFSSSTDTYKAVKGEFLAMRLAAKVGLSVAPVHLERVAERDVLLVERFDRVKSENEWQRKMMVSALTIFGLHEMMARYAGYADLAENIRHRFTDPKDTLYELFGRLTFNIICGNTDDHARNHAAFWDGNTLTLTPAFDVCPQNRTGREASQAMLVTTDSRRSTLATCIESAPNFHLARSDANDIIHRQLDTIRSEWDATCEEGNFSKEEKDFFWERSFLNPFIFDGFGSNTPKPQPHRQESPSLR